MDNLFLSAGFESSAESVLSTGNGKRVRGREANVYDAVAGASSSSPIIVLSH